VNTNDGQSSLNTTEAPTLEGGQRRGCGTPVVGGRVVVSTVDGRCGGLNAADGKEPGLEEQMPRLAAVRVRRVTPCWRVRYRSLCRIFSDWQTLWGPVSTPRGQPRSSGWRISTPVQVSGATSTRLAPGPARHAGSDTGQIWLGRVELSGARARWRQIYVADSVARAAGGARSQRGLTTGQAADRKPASQLRWTGSSLSAISRLSAFLDRGTSVRLARAHGQRRSDLVASDGRLFALDEGGKLVAYRIGGKSGR
jgi:hypothetical protein